MSEKIYALLLRLYPRHFRARYGDEAAQLFRDRAREERGILRGMRLWLDLFEDWAISVPREYCFGEPELIHAQAQNSLSSAPVFYVLEEDAPRFSTQVCAGALSLIFFCVSLIAIGHGGSSLPLRGFDAAPARSAAVRDQATARGPQKNEFERTARAANTEAGAAGPPDSRVINLESADAMSSNLNLKLVLPQGKPGQLQTQTAGPNPQDATRAMVEAFATHDIVMFGETHGNRQEYEWLCKLVKTPEFDDRVDDIVVEFGNALYQKSVDRYVAGEDEPMEDVQKAWRNMIASVPPVSPVYASFYRAVREANLARHGKHRIRLLMGSPPGDWAKIESAADLAPYEAEREQWYAQVVKNEVLAKHHRALLIMGAGHFLRGDAQALQDELLMQQHRPVPALDRASLGPGLIERELRAAGADPLLIVFGTNAIDDRGDVDRRFDAWTAPAIASLAGNWAGELPAQPVLSGGHAPGTPLELADQADELLYVGPCRSLTSLDETRAEVEGTAYGRELARRDLILLGHPVDFLFGENPQCVQPPGASR